jgi:hypothetical protein
MELNLSGGLATNMLGHPAAIYPVQGTGRGARGGPSAADLDVVCGRGPYRQARHTGHALESQQG